MKKNIKRRVNKYGEWIRRILSCFSLRQSLPWIIILLGLISTFAGFYEVFHDSVVNEISKWIGNTFIVGCIVGFMSSYAQFRGVYKNDLEDIIYNIDFLEKRKDIQEIWANVSQVLFEKKFPEISDDLLCDIREKYLLGDIDYYCSNFVSSQTISWHDKASRFIKVTEEYVFNVITTSGDREVDFTGTFSAEICRDDKESYIKIDQYLVNGNLIDCDPKETRTEDMITLETKIKLKGHTTYSVKREMTKVYCLDNDYYIGFSAKTIVKDLRVQIFNEIKDDIELKFVPRGVLKTYKNNKKRADYLEYEYNGLILQKQGFVILLKEKK